MASIIQTQTRQKNKIKQLKKSQKRMKIITIAALVVILLLLLLLGYATDWTRGLRGASSITPTSVTFEADEGEGGLQGGGFGGGGSTTTNTSTTTNRTTTSNGDGGSGGGNGGGGGGNGGSGDSEPAESLLDLNAEVGVGDNVNDILNLANILDLDTECSENLLLQTCRISESGLFVETKNLLGTNLITSVTSNLDI